MNEIHNSMWKFKISKRNYDDIWKMELQGNCVIAPIYPTNPDKDAYTDEEANILDKMHKEKIKISDAILVVNVDGYIGNSTQSEIEYAKSLNKEIIYYTDLKEKNERK